jgi:hypothetical protein
LKNATNNNALRTLYREDRLGKEFLDRYVAPKTNRICVEAKKVSEETGFALRETKRLLKALVKLDVLKETAEPTTYRLAEKPEKIMKVARRKIRKEANYPKADRGKMWDPIPAGPSFKEWAEINEAMA